MTQETSPPSIPPFKPNPCASRNGEPPGTRFPQARSRPSDRVLLIALLASFLLVTLPLVVSPVAAAVPVAAFTATPTSGSAPLTVQFTDQSTGSPIYWEWNFGDGWMASGGIEARNPSNEYTVPGTYTVTLRVANFDGSDTEIKTGYVTVTSGGTPPVAAFTATPTSGYDPLSVTFTDQSTNSPTSWSWDFGDGRTAIVQNPSHSYTAVGTYTVMLRATDAAANADIETKVGYITVSGPLQADFSADITAVVVGQSIQFTDLSTGGATPLTYQWDFNNDRVVDSTSQNPSYYYSSAGTYTVVLTVTDSAANHDTETKTDYVTVTHVDVTPPVITGLTATNITKTSATIIWATDEPATSQVEYGLDTTYGSTTALYPSPVTSHSVELTGLKAGKTYHYRVNSADGSGNPAISADNTITTPDDTAPRQPVVTDDGASTTSLTELHATWASSDPESGIVEYQYAIGTTAGGTDVVGWTSVGTNTEVTRTGLTLKWGTAYYFSVKAKNGQGTWSSVGSSNGIQVTDATPPSTPVVTDDGASTRSASQLHATWTCDDPESGIEKYQYAIGTTAGGTDVIGWTSSGTSNDVTRTGLKLTVGVTYYFSVRAKNADGLLSGVGVSDGILVAPLGTGEGDISAAGGTVQTGDGRITAVFPADAVAGRVSVTIEQIAPPSYASPPEGFESGIAYFVIEVTDASGKAVVAFSRSIALWVEYSEADVADAGGDPDNLVLAYWDEAAGEWKVLETEADTSKMTLVASTSHLSTWAVLARTTPAASGGLPPLVWLLGLFGVIAVVVPAVLILARKRFYLQD